VPLELLVLARHPNPARQTVQEGRVDLEYAAILAANIAAYGRLTGDDDASTKSRLAAHFAELITPEIGKHGGRILEQHRDEFLVEFPMAIDGVRCAARMQRAMIDRNAGEPAHRKINFRVGLDLRGAVPPGDGRGVGGGVIMAMRLRDLAAPGGICSSGEVIERVRDKLGYPFDDAGEHVFSGIGRKVRLHLLDAQTVAVLPSDE
jgi:adenylate cyclase